MFIMSTDNNIPFKVILLNIRFYKSWVILLVDGGWGKWSQWSKCNAKCPQTSGKQVRTRKCDKPAPGDGGKDCVGKNKGERSCKIKCSCKSHLFLILCKVLNFITRVESTDWTYLLFESSYTLQRNVQEQEQEMQFMQEEHKKVQMVKDSTETMSRYL